MDQTAAKLVLGFVALLIGAILASQVAVQGNTVTEKSYVTDEAIDLSVARIVSNEINGSGYNFTIANPPTGLLIEDCPITSVVYGNSTDDFTLTTDYLFDDDTGVLTVKNSTAVIGSVENATVIDYVYCPTSYTNAAWGRTSIDTSMGLYALGVFLIAVGLFYSVAKDAGIVGKS